MKFEFDKDVSKDTFASCLGTRRGRLVSKVGQEMLFEVQYQDCSLEVLSTFTAPIHFSSRE
jgi:hypothetical protein